MPCDATPHDGDARSLLCDTPKFAKTGAKHAAVEIAMGNAGGSWRASGVGNFASALKFSRPFLQSVKMSLFSGLATPSRPAPEALLEQKRWQEPGYLCEWQAAQSAKYHAHVQKCRESSSPLVDTDIYACQKRCVKEAVLDFRLLASKCWELAWWGL